GSSAIISCRTAPAADLLTTAIHQPFRTIEMYLSLLACSGLVTLEPARARPETSCARFCAAGSGAGAVSADLGCIRCRLTRLSSEARSARTASTLAYACSGVKRSPYLR